MPHPLPGANQSPSLGFSDWNLRESFFPSGGRVEPCELGEGSLGAQGSEDVCLKEWHWHRKQLKGWQIWPHPDPGSHRPRLTTRPLPPSCSFNQSPRLPKLAGTRTFLPAASSNTAAYKPWKFGPSLSLDFLICKMGESQYLP